MYNYSNLKVDNKNESILMNMSNYMFSFMVMDVKYTNGSSLTQDSMPIV